MDQKIKQDWIDALRSGKFIQGFDVLNDIRTNTYCCLGVLCELANEAGVVKKDILDDSGAWSFYNPLDLDDSSLAVLPEAVQRWAGVNFNDVSIGISRKGDKRRATTWNDTKRASFAEIADMIEVSL